MPGCKSIGENKMCGIVAIYTAGQPVSTELLEQSVAQLAPRGPDEHHTWISPDRRIGLGHARLSIIDAATGAQPIASENGNLRIIVNGEFYDYERITRELKSRGHSFRTRSDSEIALHLFEESGTNCLEALRGEFAFVIWDEENKSLFAARDRFGIKPLFYAEHDGSHLPGIRSESSLRRRAARRLGFGIGVSESFLFR